MSEVHDKIIADKEAKIADLDALIHARKDTLIKVGSALEQAIGSTQGQCKTWETTVALLKSANDLIPHIESVSAGVNASSNKLLTTMRDTKAAFVFEANQLKSSADGAKEFRYAVSDLKAAVDMLNELRPTIRELMNNPGELKVIQDIIHACQSTSKDRERSDPQASEQTGATPDVQVG